MFQPIVTLLGHGEFTPRNSELDNLLQYICAVEANEVLCENILFVLLGFDPIGLNQVNYIVIINQSCTILLYFVIKCLNTVVLISTGGIQ